MMLGRAFILVTTIVLVAADVALSESPPRGKYIKPPTAAKLKPTPNPDPSVNAGPPCEPNMLDDTCRIPSSDPISKKPEASTYSSSSKKPDATVDPIKATPLATPIPEKKPAKRK